MERWACESHIPAALRENDRILPRSCFRQTRGGGAYSTGELATHDITPPPTSSVPRTTKGGGRHSKVPSRRPPPLSYPL